MYCKISLDTKMDALRKISDVRRQNFWSLQSIAEDFRSAMKTFNSLYLLLWLIAPSAIFIVIKQTQIAHARFFYDEQWRIFYRIGFCLVFAHGYLILCLLQSFFIHATLHYHFQMKVLARYLQEETGKFRKMSLTRKLCSKLYQREVTEMLVRSVEQYQVLRELRKCWMESGHVSLIIVSGMETR